LLNNYLDLSEMPVPSVELDEARAEVARRLGTPAERPRDRQLARTLARARIARWREAAGFFVRKVGELQGRIIEQLESLSRTDDGDAEADSQPVEPESEGATAARRRRPESSESRLSKWAVGIDERNRWQIFKRSGRRWESRGFLGLKK